MLTPSEIESLRQDKKETIRRARELREMERQGKKV